MTREGAHETVCRDCFVEGRAGRRCPVCGSPRLIHHPELSELRIAHIDCDAFYAAVEKRDDPSLLDKPVIVGGGKRGVVATACYIARAAGVRSAMPMFQASRLCPDAVVVKPNFAKYAETARGIRALMESLTPIVEPLSIDEAFLDLSGTERLHKSCPAATLAKFAARVEAEMGVTVSVGLSYCKFLAKIASDLDKPRGFATIGRAEAVSFLAPRPISLIWGVGKAAQARLAADGLQTIGDLQRVDKGFERKWGAEGQRLRRLALGQDDRIVDPVRVTKSVSSETTFADDRSDLEGLERILYELSERVSQRLKEKSFAATTVTIKLKTHDFRVMTRARKLAEPTQLATRLFESGRSLLTRAATGQRFRLLGLGAEDLVSAELADGGDLADPSGPKLKARQDAIDALRARYGRRAIVRGIIFDPKSEP